MAAALPGSSHRTVAVPGNISVGTSRNLLIAAVTVMECDRRARPGDGVCVRIFVQDPQLEPVGQAIGVGRTRAAPRKVPSPDSIAASHTAGAISSATTDWRFLIPSARQDCWRWT